jgi:hypothetical protein
MVSSDRHPTSCRAPRRSLRRLAWIGALSLLALAGFQASAQALITPPTIVAGPSASILGVGNVSIAPDGTGGVVWRQLAGGVPHVFVSRFLNGAWGPPIQVDVGQPGPATFPAIAAGDGGRLLVVWVQPWVSESTGGNPPKTIYQLVSSLMEPGSSGFGPVVQVDPNDVGDGTGVYPALAMAPDGIAYVVYRVVTFAYVPNQPPPPGTPPQLRPGDQLVDVRVARFNGLFWSSLGAVNELPDQVTMRKPTAANAPAIAIDLGGDGLVVWQEPTIDGVARIWARRLFGGTLGNALEVSPEKISGRPVTVDADAPALSFSDYAEAKVAFRLPGGPGSPLATPTIFVNTLLSQFVPGADSFTGAVAVGGGAAVGPPSVAVDDNGGFDAGFTAAGQTQLVTGTETTTAAPQSIGATAGDPTLATLDPDGGGAAVWPAVDQAGRPIVAVRQLFPTGGYQTASLSAPISGPIGALSVGPSGQGDALIAFQQGLSSTTQVAVADVQVPPHNFFVFPPLKWVSPSGEQITWQVARNVIGSVSYSVVVDGQIRASGLYGLSYRFSPRALGAGVHRIRVIATDSAGERTVTPVATMRTDPNPPRVRVRTRGAGRVQITVYDRASGARAAATVISFGDGTAPSRGRLSVQHTYAARGLYLVTVSCASSVGVRAVHHIWVKP